MVCLVGQEKLDSGVSEIISPEMDLPDVLDLPDQVIVGQLVMGLVLLVLVEVDVSRCNFQGTRYYV